MTIITRTLKYIRRIALVSDTHVGSRFAIWPEVIKTEDDQEYRAKPAQLELLAHWRSFLATVDEYECDTVIHAGDLCHGTNRKQLGKLLVTPEMGIQLDAAEELLTPLIKNRRFIVISGSGYHDSLDCDVHRQIARRLKGKYLGAVANMHLKGTNRTLNLAHGEGSAAIYRTMIMDREGGHQLQAHALGKLPKLDIVVRGHWHTFFHIHLPRQHLVQVPCWMAFEPSKPYLKMYGKMQPDIGGVIILIDSENRIDVHHFLYPCPRIGDMMREL